MKKQMVFSVALAVLLAASTCAQPTDFFDLAKTGTSENVQAAIYQGADINARNDDGLTPLMVAAGEN